MQRRNTGLEWLLLGVIACSTPKHETVETPSAAQVAKERERAPEPLVAPTPGLPMRAQDSADHGKPLDAVRTLATELRQRLAAKPWSEATLTAESTVAACVLEDLLDQTHAWRVAVDELERAKPFAAETPAELAAQLDLVLARGLLRTGRVVEARELMRANGVIGDWRIIGPFANERGVGHDAVYAPETLVDFAATTRGKERDVAWRANPAPEQILGNVVLDEILRPNEQAVAYLATALRVDAPRDVALWLGTSGAFKLWHDGTLVAERKVQRPSHRDQERVLLALQPGWNRLLLKVGVDERESWMATARVTELDGKRSRDLAFDSSHGADATKAAAKSSAVAPQLVRDMLEARGDDADAARLLALYHLSIHPDDVADHTAKKHAARATQLAPDDIATTYLLARANAPAPGESTEEIRHNERLEPLKRVIERDPRHVAALLDLAEFSMNENPLPDRADELSRRACELAPTNLRATRVRGMWLSEHGRDTESEMLFDAVSTTEEGRFDPLCILGLAHTQRSLGNRDGELKILIDSVNSGCAEREIFSALIDARFARGEVEAALAVSDEWLARQPFDVARLMQTARTIEYAGRTEDARKLVLRALALCPEEGQIHRVLARLAQRDDDLAASDAALARVIELDPGYDKARRQRELLAASKQEERFEEPYRWDALARIDGVVAAGANEQVQLVDRTTVWLVETDGTEHEYEHTLLRVENTGGVKELDNYWIGYPADASLQVYNVRVIHPDKTFERAPAPRGGDSGWGGGNARGFDLPQVSVGDFVEVEYRIDPTEADVFGQYFGVRHLFGAPFPDPLAPLLRSELVVIAPRALPIFSKVQNGASVESSTEDGAGERSVHRWVVTNLARPTPQVAMPDVTEFAPMVDVSTFANWQAFAAWYWSFIEKEFVTTPAMKAKVVELTNGLTDERDKVRAIARFVGQEIRYNAWSFGTHGYEPYSAPTIFERRFGDCKDKSILLRQLLAEIGVEAHPVLINAAYGRPDEKLDIAMVNHFNHCIAYVPATAERDGYYLDATADRDPIEYVRADDQGAKVLHVRDGQGSVHQIPYTPAAECALVREYEVTLDREGNGSVSLADTSSGSFGVNLRYQFGGEKGDLAKRVSDALARSFGKVDIGAAHTSDLEDIGAPARLDVQFAATSLWSRDASGANLRTSYDEIPILGVATESADEREWDVVLDRPFEMRTKLVYKLPEGAKLASLPPDATVTVAGLVDYSFSARETPQGVEVLRTFTLHERRIPKARYADFQNALREIQVAENRTLVIADTTKPEAAKENK